MSVIVGSDYLNSIRGAANGLAELNASGQVDIAKIPLTPTDATGIAGLDKTTGKIALTQIPLTPTDATGIAGLDKTTGKIAISQIPLTPTDATAIAGLKDGKIDTTYLPTSARSPFRGVYTTEAAILAITGATFGDYAFLNDDQTPEFGFYYYNSYWGTTTTPGPNPQWEKQNQTATYLATLTAVAKAAMPYVEIPTP